MVCSVGSPCWIREDEGSAIAPLALGDPLTLWGNAGHEESLEGTAARHQGPLPCWGHARRAVAPLVPGGYFPCTSFSQPRLEELELSSICLSKGEGGCPATAPCKPPPSLGLAFQLCAPLPKKREKQRPSQGGRSGWCAVGQAPTLAPLLLPPPQAGGTPSVQGSWGPGGFPTKEPGGGRGGAIWKGGHVTLAG